MSFFEKRYYLKFKGKRHYLTAKQIYKNVLEDSNLEDNLITSVTELIRVCDRPNFPKEYSQNIKVIILNCFANLEIKKQYHYKIKSTCRDAVYYCYNSLDDDDEKVNNAKEKYLAAIINSVTLFFYQIPIHEGPTYSRICKEWKEEKLNEYSSKSPIDFKSLIENLKSDFRERIELSEENGLFEEEDNKYWKRLKTEVMYLLKKRLNKK